MTGDASNPGPSRSLTLFIFRRDLRLPDNRGLAAAARLGDPVLGCFIVDPRQASSRNKYRSLHALGFLKHALESLAADISRQGGTLHLFEGTAEEVVAQLLRTLPVRAVVVNRDYTPFSRARDEGIANACAAAGCRFLALDDCLLHAPTEVLKNDGTPYTVFTPFFRKASSLPLPMPERMPKIAWTGGGSSALSNSSKLPKQLEPAVAFPDARACSLGARRSALAILSHAASFENYERERDIPAIDKTTHLSAHLKFGTCSVREAAEAIMLRLGEDHPLLRQLYWRDFFTHVAWHFPHVFGQSFHQQYDTVKWSTDHDDLRAWQEGRTGYPIVDAAMRELAATGWMHNRLRMITASFLVKDLHIDWREGERHFAQTLTDYDPAVNNGNWQWAASTGCDSVPYFRIFNPWTQQKRFDPEAIYIRQWVPELSGVPTAEIHAWHRSSQTNQSYPLPIVDHAERARQAKQMYKAAAGNKHREE